MVWIGIHNKQTHKIEVTNKAGDYGTYLDNINIDVTDQNFGNGPSGRAFKNGLFRWQSPYHGR